MPGELGREPRSAEGFTPERIPTSRVEWPLTDGHTHEGAGTDETLWSCPACLARRLSRGEPRGQPGVRVL
ncbi:MAG: hypothetical protein ACREQ5_17695 [Candidatus Dormibacteria bacterium]